MLAMDLTHFTTPCTRLKPASRLDPARRAACEFLTFMSPLKLGVQGVPGEASACSLTVLPGSLDDGMNPALKLLYSVEKSEAQK